MAGDKADADTVETEARAAFGERAEAWLKRANRLLDGMSPRELAAMPGGAAVVLAALRKQARLAHLRAKKSPSS
jgi:hypothetical protein